MKSKNIIILAAILGMPGISSCCNYAGNITAEAWQPVYPVLSMKQDNPVMRIKLINSEIGTTYELERMTFLLNGNIRKGDITSATLYLDEGRTNACSESQPKGGKIVFDFNRTVSEDTLTCWVTLQIAGQAAAADRRIEISCNGISTDKGRVDVGTLPAPIPLRTGAALRKSGDDGVNTSRIPGLITTKKGTLIALYDARNLSDDDLQGDIDIAINRSFDGGIKWQPIQRIIDMGEWGGLPQKYNGVSDGCIICDEVTGDLIAAGLWMHGILDPKTGKWVEGLNENSTVWNHQWRPNGSQPGYDVKQSSQFLIVRSTDDGETWSEPVNITRQVKKEEYWLMAPGPGRGITMEDGTLVFPAEGRDGKGLQFSTIIYSKDRGQTWIAGEPAYYNTNECQVVELSDHSLMLNMRERSNRGRKEGNGRAIAVTSDLGKTWTEHPTSRNALIEPACQGSLLRHDYMENGEKKHVLLFLNPSSRTTRNNLTIKVSFDDGQTWPESHWLLLDEGKGAGYSCMTSIDEQTIGAFYEGSQADIQFQAIPLNDLINR